MCFQYGLLGPATQMNSTRPSIARKTASVNDVFHKLQENYLVIPGKDVI